MCSFEYHSFARRLIYTILLQGVVSIWLTLCIISRLEQNQCQKVSFKPPNLMTLDNPILLLLCLTHVPHSIHSHLSEPNSRPSHLIPSVSVASFPQLHQSRHILLHKIHVLDIVVSSLLSQSTYMHSPRLRHFHSLPPSLKHCGKHSPSTHPPRPHVQE